MPEEKLINTITEVSSVGTTLTIYTRYKQAVENVLNFFIRLYDSVVDSISFAEGELGFTKSGHANFNASLSDGGELIIVDDDIDPYFIDGIGHLVDGVPLVDELSVVASGVSTTGFAANFEINALATGYYLDVAYDGGFNKYVTGFQNKYLTATELEASRHNYGGFWCFSYPVTGLAIGTMYYCRVRSSDGKQVSNNANIVYISTLDDSIEDVDGNVYNFVTIGTQQWMTENLKTTKYADGTPISNLVESTYADWFLPSRDELREMRTELHLQGVGGFESDYFYWSSSEYDQWYAYCIKMSAVSYEVPPNVDPITKLNGISVRACRAFTSTTNYNLRDIGQAGGLIFWKSGNNYLEAAPSDQSPNVRWSNIAPLLIGTTGTAIGTGQSNTTAIINQVGHTDSAAKLCDDLSIGGWENDTVGAYCWYNNDIANKAVYGALYNWYAVGNVRKLVVDQFTKGGLPSLGWRVPSDDDWLELINQLGGIAIAGGKLKEVGLIHWDFPNTGATNESGFTALGSGRRHQTTSYGLLKDLAFFWTSKSIDLTTSYYVYLDFTSTEIHIQSSLKTPGYAVRCVRNV